LTDLHEPLSVVHRDVQLLALNAVLEL